MTATQVWANDESLTVFESGHANYGWADHRDHSLAPEMGEIKLVCVALRFLLYSVGPSNFVLQRLSLAAGYVGLAVYSR